MSKYTTELRFICENYAGKEESEGYNSIGAIIESARSKVFDFNYPIFDENYRGVLETKILKHFYLREICTETVGAWKMFLNSRMNEIMPYYNKLYESELIEFNPLYDTDLTKDYNKDGQGTGSFSDVVSETVNRDIVKSGGNTTTDTGTVTNTGTVGDSGTVGRIGSSDTDTSISGSESDVKKNKRWDIYSDTPQGALTNVENETYLTNARKIVDDGTGSTKSINNTQNSDTDYSETETRNLTETRDLTETRNLERETELNEREDDDSTKNSTTTRNRNLRDIEDYIEHIRGKSSGPSYSKLLQEFRDTFLNIDVMIINDLNDLFFGLW